MLASAALRWPTLVLLVWLPLVKWGLPRSWARLVLFCGVGSAWAAFAVWWEGDAARVRQLFARPGWALLRGVWVYVMLVAAATILLYVPLIQPWLPYAVYDLAGLFDPMPVYLAFAQGGPIAPAGAWIVMALGSLAEEWMFRAVLYWRWLPARDAEGPPRTVPHPGAEMRLLAFSVYFALLHWPQPLGPMIVALLGSLVLGNLLLWRRSLVEVAVLHVLFNWRLLV